MSVAIFGGTFDPIHRAHIAVAVAARNLFHLREVLVIPAANPPHKRHQSARYEHRLRMVELACNGLDRLVPSTLEAGSTRSYSIDTIERVRASVDPSERLYFLIGADAFAELPTWHRWPEVVGAVEFIVVTRPGHTYSNPQGAVTHPLETIAMNVSSSSIRAALLRGEQPADLDAPVFAYIQQHGLYGFASLPTPANS